ncbi:hypothetical protein IE81DRAFT_325483 [Ceraceosorus guamensis]|uniref:Uncharacterized protein n=1 Tax=Ceraceosorus guamensis TaxID=1522189 RepID=A0A316VT49_9BASI|nr:hypothetical protein IE81DRAFT_325483 [Ceraceosorus guamensis]PWN40550.1 hypothetical protein IE81DRAFT_325483 [Ceraceosorus guamensis]
MDLLTQVLLALVVVLSIALFTRTAASSFPHRNDSIASLPGASASKNKKRRKKQQSAPSVEGPSAENKSVANQVPATTTAATVSAPETPKRGWGPAAHASRMAEEEDRKKEKQRQKQMKQSEKQKAAAAAAAAAGLSDGAASYSNVAAEQPSSDAVTVDSSKEKGHRPDAGVTPASKQSGQTATGSNEAVVDKAAALSASAQTIETTSTQTREGKAVADLDPPSSSQFLSPNTRAWESVSGKRVAARPTSSSASSAGADTSGVPDNAWAKSNPFAALPDADESSGRPKASAAFTGRLATSSAASKSANKSTLGAITGSAGAVYRPGSNGTASRSAAAISDQTKSQKQMRKKAEAAKAAKQDQEQERLARLAEHRREQERERMRQQDKARSNKAARQGNGAAVSSKQPQSKASVNSNGMLVWD